MGTHFVRELFPLTLSRISYHMTMERSITLSPHGHHVLTKSEIKVSKLRREHANDFVQVYRRTNKFETSDVEIGTHLENWGKPDVFSWIKPSVNFKVEDLARRGVLLVKLADAVKCGWVNAKVVGACPF